MVLLELEPPDNIEPFYTHALLQDDTPVGVITSAAFGHRTGKALALAYLRPEASGARFTALILGERVAARTLDRPPYDPANLKLHGGAR